MFSKNPRHWLIKFVIGCGQFWLVLRTAEETNDLRGVIRAGGAFRALAPQCEIQARQKAKAGAPIGGKLQPFGARRIEVQILCSARGHVNCPFSVQSGARVRMRCASLADEILNGLTNDRQLGLRTQASKVSQVWQNFSIDSEMIRSGEGD